MDVTPEFTTTVIKIEYDSDLDNTDHVPYDNQDEPIIKPTDTKPTSEENHMNVDVQSNNSNVTVNNDCDDASTSKSNVEGTNKKRFPCPKCDQTLKNNDNLKRHLMYVHSSEEDAVQCQICYRTFKTKTHLNAHMSSIHTEGEHVPCDLCGKVFSTRKKLTNHKFYSHSQLDEPVKCNICQKDFTNAHSLKKHIVMVHPSDKECVNCQQCGKTFKNKMLLNRHIKWMHTDEAIKCTECEKVLPNFVSYKKHIDVVHNSSETMLECEICKKDFKNNHYLRVHMSRVHPELKVKKIIKLNSVPCTECDKKFTTKASMDYHYKRHHLDDKPSVFCSICNRELSDANSLKRHIEMVHSIDTATCNICDKDFKSPLNLDRHMKVTHAPPEAAQKCELCQKTFKCTLHLKVHINAVHSKNGNFVCDVCNKVFASKPYMLKHRKIHVTERRFPCKFCTKYFRSIADVNKHVRRVHSKIDDKKIVDDENVGDKKVDNERVAPSQNSLECNSCKICFVTDKELNEHNCRCADEVCPSVIVKIEIES